MDGDANAKFADAKDDVAIAADDDNREVIEDKEEGETEEEEYQDEAKVSSFIFLSHLLSINHHFSMILILSLMNLSY